MTQKAITVPRQFAPSRRSTQGFGFWAFGAMCLSTAIAAALMGAVNESGLLVSLAGVLAGLGFAMLDIGRARQGGITPGTLYAVASALACAANMAAFVAAGSPMRSVYFLYVVESHLLLASWLALAGTVLPILGFYALARGSVFSLWADALPEVSGRLDDRWLVGVASALSLAAMGLVMTTRLTALGTIGFFLSQIPHLCVFTLARAGSARKIPYALLAALLIALLESTRAVFTSYLRSEMITPVFAFTVGALLGARSFAPLRSRYFVPVYVAAGLFVVTFAAFGELRHRIGGTARIGAVYEFQQRSTDPEILSPVPQQTVLSRLSSINQLSQIGRVVEEDGFLNGETLDYLAYALVPRVLWPTKPLIAKGAWFALRIGQARIGEDGRITNSINMSIPGEFYLNFGWSGVILGCLFFGAFLSVLWATTRFWEDSTNVLGGAFGYYILFSAFGLGADIQILVTIVAMYGIFVLAGLVLPKSRQRRARMPITRAAVSGALQ